MNKLQILIIAGVLSAGAQAAEAYRYALQYSNKDFQSETTVKALYQRIREVAKDHCPNYFRERDLAGVNDCVQDVTLDIVRSIDRPALSAVAQERQDTLVAGEPEKQANRG